MLNMIFFPFSRIRGFWCGWDDFNRRLPPPSHTCRARGPAASETQQPRRPWLKSTGFRSVGLWNLYKCLFVCNRGDTMHYWTRTNYGALMHSSMSSTDNTTRYHIYISDCSIFSTFGQKELKLSRHNFDLLTDFKRNSITKLTCFSASPASAYQYRNSQQKPSSTVLASELNSPDLILPAAAQAAAAQAALVAQAQAAQQAAASKGT